MAPLYRYADGKVRSIPLLDDSGGGTTPPEPGGTVVLNSTAQNLTVRNPISNADMWSFIGTQYGSTSNFVRTSVVDVGGGVKAVNQHFTAGQFSTGDGIALTGCPLPSSGSYEEATISYDVRFLADGLPWGWGGKLPGLGGVRPGAGTNPPTGGNPSKDGWTGRFMWITPAAGYASEKPVSPVELIGYIYDPTQGSGYGLNRRTGKALVRGQWHRVTQYYRMNSIVTEGSVANADGIHRIWLDGQLVFEKTDQIYRYYQAARITHMPYNLFFGGATADWAPAVDVDIQIKFLQITSP